MDDRILAMCELSNDLLFQKIPPERMAYYVDGALEAGRAAAGRRRSGQKRAVVLLQPVVGAAVVEADVLPGREHVVVG